jgi:eIF-2B alpha/beta/delta-like uncharacterized protein
LALDPDVLKSIQDIRGDRRSGAYQLAVKAAEVMGLAASRIEAERKAQYLEEFKEVARTLLRARPSIVPVANVVAYIYHETYNGTKGIENLQEIKAVAEDSANGALEALSRAMEGVVEQSCKLLHDDLTVMTHSYSSTVFNVLTRCGRRLSVFVTESRPLYEGRALAQDLAKAGVEVTLIVDAALGHHIDEVDMVMVGADTVFPDGSVVNKMGTRLMALAAQNSGVPFYVACDSWKFSPRRRMLEEAGLEEADPRLVVEPGELEGVKVRNLFFDITPPDWVDGIVSEQGLITPHEAAEISARAKKWYLLLTT